MTLRREFAARTLLLLLLKEQHHSWLKRPICLPGQAESLEAPPRSEASAAWRLADGPLIPPPTSRHHSLSRVKTQHEADVSVGEMMRKEILREHQERHPPRVRKGPASAGLHPPPPHPPPPPPLLRRRAPPGLGALKAVERCSTPRSIALGSAVTGRRPAPARAQQGAPPPAPPRAPSQEANA